MPVFNHQREIHTNFQPCIRIYNGMVFYPLCAGFNKNLPAMNKMFKKGIWAAAGIGAYMIASSIYREVTKYKLENKVVLITGGSRGLGLVLARTLAQRGARLAICARSPEQLATAKQELEEMGAEVMTYSVDLTDRQQVEEMIGKIITHYGKLDVLINNAGIIQVGPQDSMEIEDFEASMKIHFWAPLYTMLSVLPHFKETNGGRIVNITSIGGKISVPHLLPYTVSKFALVGLSEGMNVELKKHKIQVTTVVPNLIRTGSPRNITVKGDHEAEYAWFKNSGSSPVAQEAEEAADDIIKALEYGASEAILTNTARLMLIVKSIAPGWVNGLLAIVNKLMPDNVPGGNIGKKGYESESELTQNVMASLSDRAAVKNNEY